MKPSKPNFWLAIAGIYLVALCMIIVIHNPDFLDIKNCLLFLPLYVPLIVALNIIHKNDEDYSNEHDAIRWALIIATAIVVVFKIIAGKI
ncbi:MAG: hypothetical protein IKU25_08450 [Clostridia bacterium]|nr:hypothetical protein [Clostridia bacterium]